MREFRSGGGAAAPAGPVTVRAPGAPALLVLVASFILPRPVAVADEFDEEPIFYSRTAADDPVARLRTRLEAGETALAHDASHGYLRSVLAGLDIPVSSQVLVFSKTSFQREKISPWAPRAIYFSDDAYIGWVQGGTVIELAGVDPGLGTVFYALEQAPGSTGARPPRPDRLGAECLQCHASPLTGGVPGLLVRSVYPDPDGRPILRAGSFKTTHASPLRERWGGWYVTGTHGAETHMGNTVVSDPDDPVNLDRHAGANLRDLAKLVATAPYLSPHSDIVALMVLEHQVNAHNALASANFQARRALRDQAIMNRMSGEPEERLTDSTRSRFDHAALGLLRALLLVREARFEGPIEGTSGFAAEFERRGPRDRQGRSLRELDLRHRLFKRPLSYLIYSRSFDGLPALFKEHVYRRLWDILRGDDSREEWSALKSEERAEILEILLDTRNDLPEYWHAARPVEEPAPASSSGERKRSL